MNLIKLSANIFSKRGKKEKGEKALFFLLSGLKKEIKNKKGVLFFSEGLELLSPLIQLVLKKKGGTVYQIPSPIKRKRKMYMSLVLLRDKSEMSFYGSLLKEVLKLNRENVLLDSKRNALHSIATKNRIHIRFLNKKLRV